MTTPVRCGWVTADPLYLDYHDQVWGRPVYDNLTLFGKLCFDGQQVGLSWLTILKKQQRYEQVFAGFDPKIIAQFDSHRVEVLMQDRGIVRNRMKINSIITNARAYLAMAETGEDFSQFLWQFVDGVPQQHFFSRHQDIPASTEVSIALSKALKQRGFSFVGPTIVYAFMQAVGMVNDHLVDCHCYQDCARLGQANISG
ncbi:DNA-3-methyladenine glycosylase I [Shewanella sp. NFH-SH190041]|uniref:DNA-3-methyladenine glycosylase I n=1 Tax=Shewanella sp. NFH-SH190041 TaxID=2950245 RepID=UPI0021C3B1A2|nr:DNA-3-methyladenine glycosylase I [Shewanella sp. NFH-SH190041]BDM62555.1 DNA-3-methyladenine glycosylase I [Shewanella sp. NFH-SH190041]